MAKTRRFRILKELKEAKELYLSAVAKLEDSKLDHYTREKATVIIQETQIHSEIALDHITS